MMGLSEWVKKTCSDFRKPLKTEVFRGSEDSFHRAAFAKVSTKPGFNETGANAKAVQEAAKFTPHS
jgi:hypothetical protein